MKIKVVKIDWVGDYTDGKIVHIGVAGSEMTVPLEGVMELAGPGYCENGGAHMGTAPYWEQRTPSSPTWDDDE